MNTLKKILGIIWLLLAPVVVHAQKKENKNDFREKIDNQAQWDALSGKPLSAKYGNVGSIKIVYDIKEKKLYYINSRRYKFHFEFCSKYLNTYSSLEEFNMVEYSTEKDRKYLLANPDVLETLDQCLGQPFKMRDFQEFGGAMSQLEAQEIVRTLQGYRMIRRTTKGYIRIEPALAELVKKMKRAQ